MSYIRSLKKMLYPNNIISRFLFSLKGFKNDLGRDNQDEQVLNFYRNASESKLNIAAIYRVKNGQEYIELSILSIVALVKEIIFIDNGSTDATVEIVTRLKSELSSQVDIKIFHYGIKTALAGSGYSERVKETPESSLSRFYKFAFSKGTQDYLIKCDAHYIFTPSGIEKIKKNLYSGKVDVIYYSGVEIFGKSMGLEPFIFKADSGYDFIDGELYERLIFRKKINKAVIRTPVFVHVKRISYSKMFFLKEDKSAVGIKYAS